MKDIAVIVPAYNAERTIADCLHSVKIQTVPTFLVVINDCSNDKTGKIASNYADLLIRNQSRSGKARSINNALQHIQHEYVLILDSDTYLERKFIEKLRHRLQGQNYDGGSGTAKYIGKTKFAKEIAKRWSHAKPTWRYNGCCQFFKTELLRKEKLNETCLVEDEEIYWRFKNKNTALVNAIAYSEAPLTPKKWLKQQFRWNRGAHQLARNCIPKQLPIKDKINILSVILGPIFLLAMIILCSWSLICYFSIGTILLLILTLLSLASAQIPSFKQMKLIHYFLVSLLLLIYSFFEIFLFNRQLDVASNW